MLDLKHKVHTTMPCPMHSRKYMYTLYKENSSDNAFMVVCAHQKQDASSSGSKGVLQRGHVMFQ
jgi:hypothetical protein